ncbi:cyclin-P4-1-like [Triticum dicoccoides]|uniref:cyclin-P4-1-like n=1 Tax=Triticum dicoccoides TaxID=85692 RepID=UPI00189118D9|nr:cyclin-P4-1-like [Triticum dicoccoides]
MEMERRASSSKRASGAPPKVVAVLAGLLERAAKRGDAVECGSGSAAFRGPTEKKPEIGVRRYAERIYRYAGCSPACFVVAYAYLDRLAAPPQDDAGEDEAAAVAVNSYSVHRLLITSVMVAAKFMDDIHYNNAYFARVGGVEVREMNGLELEFLFALRFRLNVTPDDFASYCAALEGEMLTTTTPPPLSPPAVMVSVSVSPEEDEDVAAVAGGGIITAFATAARVSVAEITQ